MCLINSFFNNKKNFYHTMKLRNSDTGKSNSKDAKIEDKADLSLSKNDSKRKATRSVKNINLKGNINTTDELKTEILDKKIAKNSEKKYQKKN